MKKRMFFCFFIFVISILHSSIPNVVFGQSLAKQVFNEYEELLLQNDIRALFPDVLVSLKNPQRPLSYNTMGFIVNSPNLLIAYVPDVNSQFIDLLKVNDNLKLFLIEDPVRNLILDPTEIDELLKLINQAPTTPTSLEKVASTDNQYGNLNAPLQPFEVVVKDLNDNPLEDILVTFSVTVGDGEGDLSTTSVLTNNKGEAQTTLTLGSAPGIYKVEAKVVKFPSLTQTFTAATGGICELPTEPTKPTTLAIVSGNNPKAQVIFNLPIYDVEDTFTQTIDIRNATDLVLWVMTIKFNPKVFEVVNVTYGDFFKQSVEVIRERADLDKGKIRLGQFGEKGGSSDGTLVSIKFKSKSSSEELLSVSDVILSTVDGELSYSLLIHPYAAAPTASALTLTPETAEETKVLLNYPNPFNPETWIPYQLAKATDVTVTIYAVNGSLIRTLELGHQAAGIYKSKSQAAYWDGRNEFGELVASGLYFYTLTAGDFMATRKMLIRK